MRYAVIALLVAVAGTAGSLFLSLGMGLRACPLCFYQRSFIMAVAAVLGIGLLADRRRSGLCCLLCLPLALGGLGVAAFHEFLVLAGTLECPQALLGMGTAPAQSLVIFALLAVSVAAGAWSERPSANGTGVVGLSAVVGALLAWGSVASAPPLPPAPKAAYDPEKQPLDMCRPPFRGDAVTT